MTASGARIRISRFLRCIREVNALSVPISASSVGFARVEEGGDMYEDHLRYLENVAAYDAGGDSTSYAVHKAWADSMTCPVLTLDGADDLEKNASLIAEAYRKAAENK